MQPILSFRTLSAYEISFFDSMTFDRTPETAQLEWSKADAPSSPGGVKSKQDKQDERDKQDKNKGQRILFIPVILFILL